MSGSEPVDTAAIRERDWNTPQWDAPSTIDELCDEIDSLRARNQYAVKLVRVARSVIAQLSGEWGAQGLDREIDAFLEQESTE